MNTISDVFQYRSLITIMLLIMTVWFSHISYLFYVCAVNNGKLRRLRSRMFVFFIAIAWASLSWGVGYNLFINQIGYSVVGNLVFAVISTVPFFAASGFLHLLVYQEYGKIKNNNKNKNKN